MQNQVILNPLPYEDVRVNGKDHEIGGNFNFDNAISAYKALQEIEQLNMAYVYFHDKENNIDFHVDMLIALQPNYEPVLLFFKSIYRKYSIWQRTGAKNQVMPYRTLDN